MVESMCPVLFLTLVAPTLQTPPVVLKANRHVGDEVHWIQKSNMVSNILPVGVEMLVDEKVTQVGVDGSYTVAVTQGKSRVSWAFQDLSTPDEPVVISYRCRADGEVFAVEADPIYVDWARRARNLESVILPDHPVRVGDSWTHAFPAARGSYKLLSVAGGVATIHIEVKETEGVSPASCAGEVKVRLSDFATVSMNVKLKDAAVPGLPGLGTGAIVVMPIKG
jgi:hypothetical protein